MTLQEAIEKILKEAGKALSAELIAKKINQDGLYFRNDKNPVPSSQIIAHINNFPENFLRRNNKIGLFSSNFHNISDYISKKPKKLKDILENITKEIFNEYNLSESESVIFVCVFTIVVQEIGVKSDWENLTFIIDVEDFNALLLKMISEEHVLREAFEILIKNKSILTKDFFYKRGYDLGFEISLTRNDEFVSNMKSYLDNAGLFGKQRFLEKFNTPDLINKLLIELADPKDNEVVLDPAAGVGKTLLEVIRRNKNVQIIGQEIDYNSYLLNKIYFYLEDFLSYKLYCTDSLRNPRITQNSTDLVISDIPFGTRINDVDFDFSKSQKKSIYSSEELFIEFMLSRLNTSGRIITTVPLGILSSLSTTSLRTTLVENDLIESIVSLPHEAYYPFFGVNSAILIINKNKRPERKNKIIFIDLNKQINIQVLNNQLKIDEKQLNDVLKNISLIINNGYGDSHVLNHFIATRELIIEQDYDLSPRRYISEIFELLGEVSNSERLIQLDEILERLISSDRVTNAEDIKFIQVKDLNDNPIEFYLDSTRPKKTISEAVRYRIINESALLLSRIGDEIRPTYFEYHGQTIGINTNILAFRVKKGIINIEYLITQLNSEFFQKQLELIISGTSIPSIQPKLFLKLRIPVPVLSEQYNRLAIYKEQYANRLTITQFINNIKLVSTNQEIKNEIERFAKKSLPQSKHISFKREFEFDKLPFSSKEIEETKYMKRSKEGHYFNLVLLDKHKRIHGILAVESEKEISFEQYSEINAYTNFILQTSSKYIQENTNRLLNEFSHTTKNILKDINKIIGDFLDTPNKEFQRSMKNSLIKDEELINYLIKTDNKKREDFIAYNRLGEAYNIVNKHIEFFKRRHEYFTKTVNTKAEEIELFDFLDRLPISNTRIELNNRVNTRVILHIKAAPIELAFNDLINNAKIHSSDEMIYLDISDKDRYIQFVIKNKVKNLLSKENYEMLGLEDIKKADGTYSTGLSNAFRCISEENDINLASYEKYNQSKYFEIIIKLTKK